MLNLLESKASSHSAAIGEPQKKRSAVNTPLRQDKQIYPLVQETANYMHSALPKPVLSVQN